MTKSGSKIKASKSTGRKAAERERMIAEAAYFRAERRGFSGGDSVTDWLAAEKEVDHRLRQPAAEPCTKRASQAKTNADKPTPAKAKTKKKARKIAPRKSAD